MKKILLIEPSATFAQFMKYVLSKLGYQVSTVDIPDEVDWELSSNRPDLIIAETKPTELSGIELCKRLRKDEELSTIPIVIISIDSSAKTRRQALSAGCTDFLTKPVTAHTIHELMQQHLPFHHKRQNIRARIEVTATIVHRSRSYEMNTLTVSEGGMYVLTQKPFKTKTVVELSLPLPGLKNRIELKGEVIYEMGGEPSGFPKGMGIKFLDIEKNTVTLMRYYIESYLSGYLWETHPRNP